MLRRWLLALSLPCLVLTAEIRGRIEWNELCTGVHELGYARAILDDGKSYYGGITQDGSFHIPNVEPGTYVLSIVSQNHAFDHFRIDIPPTTESSLHSISPYIPGTPLSPPSTVKLPYPISLQARRRNEYYAAPASFNAVQMLQSPMVLMMIVAGVLMFATPALMKSIDPEAMGEMNQRQAQLANMQSSFINGDFRSGFSELMKSMDEPTPPPTQAAPSAGVKARSKGKRR